MPFPHRLHRVNHSPATGNATSWPTLLLLRVHILQSWRRLKGLRNESRLLTSVIGLFIVGYLGLSWWLFRRALAFIDRFPGLGAVLAERLLYLLFAFLFALLLLSNLVICHSNFFRNREVSFLLNLPIPAGTVFRWKFAESVLLASWAFLFLIAPLMVAFGQTREVAWHFYPVAVTLLLFFIVLPGVIGAWLALQLARWLDRRAFQWVVVGLGAAGVIATLFWWKTQPDAELLEESRVLDVLDRLLIKSRFAEEPPFPSYWLASAIIRWADNALRGAVFFALVLLSNTLFFGSLAGTRFGRRFLDTFSIVHSRGARAKRSTAASAAWTRLRPLDRFLRWLPWLPDDARALVAKDVRTFWRDTTQWAQSVVLFGLLGVYIINLRQFTQHLTGSFWINLIACLNLAACALNLATLTTRFVYPQFSLEGRRLWIVGMAPAGLRRVVQTKYWLASTASLAVTVTLITLSTAMLRMPPGQILFFAGVVSAMTFCLNGLAVGLGVLYPNFKETDSSKIVSGFGGTLCLVVSFLYILISVLLLGFGAGVFRVGTWSVAAAIGLFALLSLAVGGLPLAMGFRKLRTLEI